MDKDLYLCLRDRNIISILDGDTKFETYTLENGISIIISMPYLTGSEICSISNLFGAEVIYNDPKGILSRWQYFDNLLKYCIDNNKCLPLLKYLFSLHQFSKMLEGKCVDDINKTRKIIISKIIEKINSILACSEKEMKMVGEGPIICIQKDDVKLDTPVIKFIDREYISNIYSRAMSDIEDGNFDSSITKSRTLLEETFCYVIEKKGEEPETDGDIMKLYKQVRLLYNMDINTNTDERIKKLLSGLNSIVSSIAEMRNKNSDSHGLGSRRIGINEHYARLAINSAAAMSEFILSLNKNN